ncbi:hypothetical protein BDZ89DRAFT_1041476 [Hymenopellis radicata]|nr:hypothetical protein BDZ89DRAFT_1041476 [Hymenopellis radicata]
MSNEIMATVLSSPANSTIRTPEPSDESPDLEICSTCADADGESEKLTEHSPHVLCNERKATVSTADKVKDLKLWVADVFVATRWILQTEADDVLERGPPGLIAPSRRAGCAGSEKKKLVRERMDTTNDEVIPRKTVGDKRVPLGAVGNVEKAYTARIETPSSTRWPPNVARWL